MKIFGKQKKRKRTRRPIFGFPCSVRLAGRVRAISKELGLVAYSVAEHSMAVGIDQMVRDMQNDDTRRALHTHVLEEHFLAPYFDEVNRYDRRIAGQARGRQLRNWQLDRVAHELVGIVERAGISADVLVEITRRLVTAEQKRRRGYRERDGGGNHETYKDA